MPSYISDPVLADFQLRRGWQKSAGADQLPNPQATV